MPNTPDLIRVQFPNSGVAFTYTSQGERDRSLRLAEARQQLAHEGAFLPTWQELTDAERIDSELEARNWLRAADRAGLLAPAGDDTEAETTEMTTEQIHFFTLAFGPEADAGALGVHTRKAFLESLGKPNLGETPATTYVVNTVDHTVRINWRAASREEAISKAIRYVEAHLGQPVTIGSDPIWDRIAPQDAS